MNIRAKRSRVAIMGRPQSDQTQPNRSNEWCRW